MRRSIVISTLLAASVAALVACDPKTPEPVKPVTTPVRVASSSPLPSPSTSPTGTAGKPGTTPEVKKAEAKDVNKNVKPPAIQTPKAK